MIEFGTALKKAREAVNISLEEIFEKTRISIKHLKAIEAGNFPAVPQTYVRAFIREYARVVGLDEEKIIRTYNEIAEREKGIPKPPDVLDHSNILPQLDETIEIVPVIKVIPRHVEVQGTAEVEEAGDFIPPVKKSAYISDDHQKPIDISTVPKQAQRESAPQPEKRDDPQQDKRSESVKTPLQTQAKQSDHPVLKESVSRGEQSVTPPPVKNERIAAPVPPKATDAQKQKLRSEIFEKMIAPSAKENAGQSAPGFTQKPHRSVYDLKPPIPSEEKQARPAPVQPKEESSEEEKRLFIIGVLIIVMVAVIIYGFFHFSSDESETTTGLIDSTALKASIEAGKFIDSAQSALVEQMEMPADTGKKIIAAADKVIEPSPKVFSREDSLVLEAFSSAPVWFSVRMDTMRSERGSLGTNDHRIWKAKDRFTITLGDAGAVTFFLNGKEIGALGEEGAVLKNFTISKQNLKTE